MDMKFIVNVSDNDTIKRRAREQQFSNHLKQHQAISSDDEHEAYPSPVVVVRKVLNHFSASSPKSISGRRSTIENPSPTFRCIIY